MQGPVVSSKKITLSSEFFYFDMFPFKKYQECIVKIPETVLLDKGFVREWLFNSHKQSNNPILKKKRQNMSPIAVIKAFCNKFGYGSATHSCVNIQDIRDQVKIALKQQKDYDFAKDKKVIEVVTITNDVLSMSLTDFLEYVAQNKYAEQQFYEKWKIIQEKCSGTKIDEYYEVQNIRHNHLIESRCKKIISLNTTEAQIISTQLENDPYKKASPSRNFSIAGTKTLEGYKFFDTFLNKKFFKMSQDLIQFIEKNYKCLVESVNTKFVINKDREPHFVGAFDLQIKPAKKITEMKDFQLTKDRGAITVEDYYKFLEVYIAENMEKMQRYDINTPINERRKKCQGKFCRIPLEDVSLPALIQQKYKIPGFSTNSRIITQEMRDAVLKRKRRVIEKLMQNGLIENDYDNADESSQYQTSNQEDEGYNLRTKSKQIKVCQICFLFYFHASRFYEVDVYGNLVQKKVIFMPSNTQKKPQQQSLPPINFKKPYLTSPPKKTSSKTDLQNHSFEAKPQIVQESTTQKLKKIAKSKSSSKFESMARENFLERSKHKLKTQRKISGASLSKIKLEPVASSKKNLPSEENTEKGNRLLNLTKLSQPMKLKQRSKPEKSQQILPLKERRPQNHEQAIEQLIRKLSSIPYESKDEFIWSAKKYYKDNLPQPIDRRSFSNFYYPTLYQFMNNSQIVLHPKQRIKKRPEMSLKRLSELSDYPEIVSRSEFLFDTLIVNEQTTIPFCIITTKVVNPDNIRSSLPFQNIFLVNDIFDSFIEQISMAKQILEEDQVFNKRIILFNYAGQSHTIYNQTNIQNFSMYFSEIVDKIMYRLSGQKNQLKIIDLERDLFKFIGMGYGGYLLAQYIGHSYHYFSNISGIMIVNSYMRMPDKYKETLQNLLNLYSSDDPTVKNQPFLHYNKAINSQQVSAQELQHKSGLNSIRIQDRIYLLQSALKQIKYSSTEISSIQPVEFEYFQGCQVSIVYGRDNTIIPKESCQQYLTYRKNKKEQIPGRVYIQLKGGHDILADNYQDMNKVLVLFCRK